LIATPTINWVQYPFLFWGVAVLLHTVIYKEGYLKTQETESNYKKITPKLVQKNRKNLPKNLDDNLDDNITKEMTRLKKEELEKTESEMKIEKNDPICVVHKGKITGTIYLCPECNTSYCLKCAKTLKNKGEGCWNCGREITP
jgi:hypothetical protein